MRIHKINLEGGGGEWGDNMWPKGYQRPLMELSRSLFYTYIAKYRWWATLIVVVVAVGAVVVAVAVGAVVAVMEVVVVVVVLVLVA